jgi:hypothetical protein
MEDKPVVLIHSAQFFGDLAGGWTRAPSLCHDLHFENRFIFFVVHRSSSITRAHVLLADSFELSCG